MGDDGKEFRVRLKGITSSYLAKATTMLMGLTISNSAVDIKIWCNNAVVVATVNELLEDRCN